MGHFVLELADRAVAVAAEGRVLAIAPSAVFDGTARSVAGVNAWRELRVRPRAISTRHLGAVLTQRGVSARVEMLLAAELKSRLSEQPLAEGQRAWIVAPANAEAAGLTALLGIAQRMGFAVDGFVDSATVVTAGLGVEQSTIVLELGLHHAAATLVECAGEQARRRRSAQSERGGLIELYQAWLDLVSTTMVKRTRFDPLHDAATEQRVFESIPALALEAARTGSATVAIAKGTDLFETSLTRDQFAQAAQPIYRAIVGLLHQLRPAGVPVAIVMPHLAADLPGLREQLEQFVGCELVSVPDGFAAAVTSLLELPAPPSTESAVTLLRRLPILPQAAVGEVEFDGASTMAAGDTHTAPSAPRVAHANAPSRSAPDGRTRDSQPDMTDKANVDSDARAAGGTALPEPRSPVDPGDVSHGRRAEGGRPPGASRDSLVRGVARVPLGQRRVTGPAPSHVLWEGRAYPLQPDTLVVGRESTVNPRYITLPDGLAGVSRRHCTFVHDGDELVLLDHSTFGTFVNGERVQERVRIYAGDRVRLGEPGVELTLIAVGPQQPHQPQLP